MKFLSGSKGYDFKPRWHKGKVIYSPGMGKGALMCMMEKMKTQWCLNRKISMPLEAIAKEVTPMIRGWINYYGHYRRSELYCLGYHVDQRLVRFLKKKHKKIRSWAQGWEELKRIRKESPRLFPHWYEISQKRRAV